MTKRAPAVFISHGSPTFALNPPAAYARDLRAFATRFPAPAAIVIVSAHWETPGPIRVNASPSPGVLHDFGGFPDILYTLDYAARGDPALARSVIERLRTTGSAVEEEDDRPWDHGVWVPLRIAFPKGDVALVQVSLPRPRRPDDVLALGAALAPLRDAGVWLVGSGGMVHNLSELAWRDEAAPAEPWAVSFETWALDVLRTETPEAIAAFRSLAPEAGRAHPSTEHFDPLVFAAGARLPGDDLIEIHRGVAYATLSLASFAFAPAG